MNRLTTQQDLNFPFEVYVATDSDLELPLLVFSYEKKPPLMLQGLVDDINHFYSKSKTRNIVLEPPINDEPYEFTLSNDRSGDEQIKIYAERVNIKDIQQQLSNGQSRFIIQLNRRRNIHSIHDSDTFTTNAIIELTLEDAFDPTEGLFD